MKKTLLLLFSFLFLLLSVFLLVSCKSKVPPVVLMENGGSPYVIVRSDTNPDATDAAVLLREEIERITGVLLPIMTDWRDNPVSDYEILVGETNREAENEIDRRRLAGDGYAMKLSGSRVILTGGGKEGALAAVREFLEKYVTPNGISVPGDLNVFRAHEYDIGYLSIDGTDIYEFTIVYDDFPSLKTAARDLHDDLYAACGADLPVTTDTKTEGKRIYIHASDPDTESFSYKSDERGVTISGGKTRGAMYGVYAFLEECVGMRYLASDTQYCRSAETIRLKNLDRSYTPPFEYRDIFCYDYFDGAISAKRMVNAGDFRRTTPEEYGGKLSFTGGFVHTLASLAGCSAKEQPCLTDEEVYETVLENVLKLLGEHPDAKMISISQNDNQNPCSCAKCRSLAGVEGGYSGVQLQFVNRIAEEVEKQYPDVLIETLAYQYTRMPPVTKPRDNVLIMLCVIEKCSNHLMEDSSCTDNAPIARDIAGWGKISDRVYIWDYLSGGTNYLVPLPNFHTLRDNIRYFRDAGMKGYFSLDNYLSYSVEFGELRSYLVSLLLKDPDMTEEEYDTAVNDFLYGYYGDGWEEIRKYYDFIENNRNARFGFKGSSPAAVVFGSKTFGEHSEELVSWFDAALAQAKDDKTRAHIERLRISCEYCRIDSLWDTVMKSDDTAAIGKLRGDAKELYNMILRHNIRTSESRDTFIVTDFSKKPSQW